MKDPSKRRFPKSVDDIVATLTEIYRHESQPEIVELLEGASARIEQIDYDNWDGGTYTYALFLEVPVPIFIGIESRLEEIEKDISSKLSTITRNLSNIYLYSVTITPLSSSLTGIGPKAKPFDTEVKHIWLNGYFRLFLSHVSAHKSAVAHLKNQLQLRAISAFVAHEDIMPNSEWQNEIELALRSMHALTALLTPDFHPSNWTDQEIGFALGRGNPVIAVRLGSDPYGFIGKVQALPGSLEQTDRLAELLAKTILGHPATRREMRRAVINAFTTAFSFENTKILSNYVAMINDFTDDEKTLLQQACIENTQISSASGVTERVFSIVGRPRQNQTNPHDDILTVLGERIAHQQ